ncbi:hypothetical protein ASE00_16290 [Sphingomonas sp. Root710]|uniref:DUF4429 domain-containing protein n=1 Tax=Sphingomonas sp. Root710 TaxID=1736594 RepID=UPI0006F22496|nr:DUF4429 domain-containing protein [Sphingomonas sp. Root710]KRB80606.1 hypothetical protein ASE00_16290 [Sphingomonas sp. Root710]
MLMVAKGAAGAAIELHDHHLVIRRRGVASMLHGIGGDKSIPLSSITSVQFKSAGILMPGEIRFSLMGETAAFLKERDPNRVQFRGSQQGAFERLRSAIHSKINLPSLQALAVQSARAREANAEWPTRVAGGGTRYETSTRPSPLQIEDHSHAQRVGGDWEAAQPLDPSAAGWLAEHKIIRGIAYAGIVLFCLLAFLAMLADDPSTPIDGNGVEAAQIEDAPTATEVTYEDAPPVSADDRWLGQYSAAFDGASGTVEITPQTGGRLAVSIDMAGERCAGSVAAVVDRPEDNLITVAKAPYEDGDDQESSCRISLRKNGDELSITEEEVCMNHHGMSCGFNGVARRTQ